MIDLDFVNDRQPEPHDRLHEDIEEMRLDEQRRKADTLQWLDEHAGFRPIGSEW